MTVALIRCSNCRDPYIDLDLPMVMAIKEAGGVEIPRCPRCIGLDQPQVHHYLSPLSGPGYVFETRWLEWRQIAKEIEKETGRGKVAEFQVDEKALGYTEKDDRSR